MTSLPQILHAIHQPAQGKHTNSRKRYQKPQLKELGDLRTLTLGGSPGVGDSTNGGIQKPPGT